MASEARLRALHYGVLIWCAVIIIFDGYDLAVAGIALPSIMKELAVDPKQVGILVSTALVGMMVGNILMGTLAEAIGRRCHLHCAVQRLYRRRRPVQQSDAVWCSTLPGWHRDWRRQPNVIAQMTEYAPRRVRSTMVTFMFSGYSIGGMLAAALGKGLIESYGWQSVFLAAGLPVLLIPFILKSMPESMPYLIRCGKTDELKRLASRIDANYRASIDDKFVLSDAGIATPSAPVNQLFQHGRTRSTLMFWLSCFMCLFMVYALSSWLTKLMANAGYSLGSALAFVLVLNFGGMVGAIGGGWLADRFHIKHVLIFMYVLATVSITLLGYPMPTGWLYLLVGLAGASTIGTALLHKSNLKAKASL